MKLYSYCRSSTAYRVRIALNLKGVDYETIPVNLLKSEQRNPEYLALNPTGGVPALEHDGAVIAQSLAIIDWLEEIAPEPRLYWGGPAQKAFMRQIALTIATDIHPLVNLKVVKHLGDRLGADDAAKAAWTVHWIVQGLEAVEKMLQRSGCGPFAFGDKVSAADLCIVPQMYSARRNKIPLENYPLCRAVEQHCIKLEPFIKAAPESQPDAPEGMERIHGRERLC